MHTETTAPTTTAANVRTLCQTIAEKIQQRHEQQATVTGLPTGFTDIDARTLGLQPGDLIVVAGCPSAGKTTFALNILEHVSINLGLPAAYFSNANSPEQLVSRMLTRISRIDARKLQLGALSEDEWSRFSVGMEKLYHAPIHLAAPSDDPHSNSPQSIREWVETLQQPPSLLIVDDIQLFAGETPKQDRKDAIAQACRELKAFALQKQIPVMLILQLPRAIERRKNPRPLMVEIAECGISEEYADLIVTLYREECYLSDSQDKGLMEVTIGYHREGIAPTTILLAFLSEYLSLENLRVS